MSKINYPEETGVFVIVEHAINDSMKKLDEALNQCAMTVPSSFAYINYLRALPGEINGYKKEANEILVSAKNIDNNFKFAFEDIDSSHATLPNDILETRDRLVK